MNNSNDQMHPEDLRNLFIFMIVSLALWFAYDVFILGPQKEALQKAKQAAQVNAVQEEQVVVEAVQEQEVLDRSEVLQENRRVKIDNGKVFGSISVKGGRFDDISFHEYFETRERENNVSLLSPKKTEFPRYIDYGWVAGDEGVVVPDSDTRWSVLSKRDLDAYNQIILEWNNGQGLTFRREISIDKQYLFTVKQSVINHSGGDVTLYPYALIAQKGISKNFEGRWLLHEGPIGYFGNELKEVSYKDLQKEGAKKYQADRGWTGVTDKYWLTGIIPPQGETNKYSFNMVNDREVDSFRDGRFQVDVVGQVVKLKPGQSAERLSYLFTGPKRVLMLEDYEKSLSVPKLDLAVNFGWFWFLSKPFFYVLHFLGLHIGNMGFAIILLTVLIRMAVFPLTNTSYKSFGAMKKIQPQVMALREVYGEDKAKLQEELMKLYQKEGVNPLAGCLPILFQIPIFFALYKVLYVTIEIRQAPFVGWIHDLSAPDPTTIFNLFGLIPWDPPSFLMIGVWPCLMLLAMVIQKKLNPPPQDPLQRDMANYFPFIMCYIMSQFPSGLVVYWTFSAWIGLLQQMFIMRSMGVPIHLFGETEEDKMMEEAVEKGPAVHPLVEMVEEEVEDALFGEGEDDEPSISPPKPKKKTKKKKK